MWHLGRLVRLRSRLWRFVSLFDMVNFANMRRWMLPRRLLVSDGGCVFASIWFSLYVWMRSKRVFVSVIAQLRLLS